MNCTNHPDKESKGTCNLCAKAICPDCAVELKGELYCKNCLSLKMGETKKPEHSPALAAILSFIIAGLGQVYNGQVWKGLLVFLTSWLILPWIVGIFDAYFAAKKINEGKIVFKKRTGCLITMIIGVFLSWIMIFIIAMLAAIAIPGFLKARAVASEKAAKATLQSVSTALELYATQNNNMYPENEASLTVVPPLNNREAYGYVFKEELKTSGYKITAIPLYCDEGVYAFTIETGGKLSQEACEPENDYDQED
jgi:TM2 domain-containing membrane protein YozV/Tfp pilus assembly protein PilE